jgi:hypothetical protein
VIQTQLEPKFRSETNDILVSAIENHMKSRLQHAVKIEKEIIVQRKALVILFHKMFQSKSDVLSGYRQGKGVSNAGKSINTCDPEESCYT